MDLIKELQSENPREERLLELITDGNVSYIDNHGCTPLMYAFSDYGKNPDCDHHILSKMLDMNCIPEQVAKYSNYTALMYAFMHYGRNPNCDHNILLKLLNMNCNPNQVNKYGYTALMLMFAYYGKNSNCNSRVLLKLLDMDCRPEQANIHSETALMFAFRNYGSNPNCNHHVLLKLLDMNCSPEKISRPCNSTTLMFAFKYYGSNPNYDPNIFLKLIILLYPSITRPKLIDLLDTNTTDHSLQNNILGVYNYNHRRTIINSRVSKRVSKGKYDSRSIFD